MTLVELLVVLMIVGLAMGGASLALRDTAAESLNRDAERLIAILESARAQSRVQGVAATWHATAEGFEISGLILPDPQRPGNLPASRTWRWLSQETRVADTGLSRLILGPEALIGPQRIRLLQQGETHRHVDIQTNGLDPFRLDGTP